MYKETRLGGIEKWYNFPPSDANMRIPNDILHSVCFLCIKNQDKFQSIGTAFFVKVSGEELDFSYLFTAKHVIDGAKEYGYETIYARINTYGKGFEYKELGEIDKWISTEDIDIDIAFLPFGIDQRKYEAKTIPVEMIVSEEILKNRAIGIGDDLFSVGLFTKREGVERNLPIIRTGIISAMPIEPLKNQYGEEFLAYLAELRSIGGLSGSPVFVYLDKNRIYIPDSPEKHDFEFFLLGVMRGHWDARLYKDIEPLGNNSGKIEPLNTGIAIVTPAKYILDFLNHPQMIQLREKATQHHENTKANDNFVED